MSPLGHLALGALAVRLGGYRGRAAACCLLGAFLPDLVDKPLGALGVVPSFHTVGHSVLVLGGAVGVVYLLGRGRPLLLGWASHLVGDLPLAVPVYLDHYVWPVLAPSAPPAEPVRGYVLGYATSPAFAAELGLFGLALWFVVRGPSAAERDRPRDDSP
ncbi:MAG: metal-dependent hydrolase [Haloplanus sp.]